MEVNMQNEISFIDLIVFRISWDLKNVYRHDQSCGRLVE